MAIEKGARTIEVGEVFISLEGEGPHTSRPTAYVRAARCNFKCPMFNNHHGDLQTNGYATLSFQPKDYNSLQDIPLITTGCDSQYSVNPAFAHMWRKMSADEVARELVSVLPKQSWIHPITGTPVILSLTGGEPTLHSKFWPDLLNHPLLSDMSHVLIETNCAVPLRNEFTMELSGWLAKDPSRLLTWSNSPKLSTSGEVWEEAIRPDIAMKQRWTSGGINPNQFEQYFKFVVAPTEESFNEVMAAMTEYWKAGVPKDVEIWCMPTACTKEQQQEVAAQVARMCMEYGFLYSHRLQNDVWGNGVGT